jgi:hypothetical protein
VELRGWDFPHIDTNNPPVVGEDWVGQESEWKHHLEAWRLYQSGQFRSVKGLPDDWRDRSSVWPASERWEQGQKWGIFETIYQATEVFELASRLSLSDVGAEGFVVSMRAVGLEGRSLVMEDPARNLSVPYLSGMVEYEYAKTVTREALVADSRGMAIDAASDIIRRFAWDPPRPVVEDIQSQLVGL